MGLPVRTAAPLTPKLPHLIGSPMAVPLVAFGISLFLRVRAFGIEKGDLLSGDGEASNEAVDPTGFLSESPNSPAGPQT